MELFILAIFLSLVISAWGGILLKELKEKVKFVDLLEDEITRRQEDTRLWQKLQEQLEAVKKFVEKGPLLDVETLEDCQQAVDDWLGKLMNVLEAEAE